jgi:hypothetical protein
LADASEESQNGIFVRDAISRRTKSSAQNEHLKLKIESKRRFCVCFRAAQNQVAKMAT